MRRYHHRAEVSFRWQGCAEKACRRQTDYRRLAGLRQTSVFIHAPWHLTPLHFHGNISLNYGPG
jgi:hypothetical protein